VEQLTRAADDFLRARDGLMRAADEFLRAVDGLTRAADEFLRAVDGLTRAASRLANAPREPLNAVEEFPKGLSDFRKELDELRFGLDELRFGLVGAALERIGRAQVIADAAPWQDPSLERVSQISFRIPCVPRADVLKLSRSFRRQLRRGSSARAGAAWRD